MTIVLFIILAYLVGAIPFGYLAGRMCGVDLREHGSCNIGATNAIRVLGKKVGIAVFICDFLKGFAPVFIWKKYGASLTGCADPSSWIPDMTLVCVSMAAILGHTFTCFLHFKGGKGVATTAGVLFALSPLMGGISLVSWVLFAVITRYVSLSSMLASVVMVVMGMYEFGFLSLGGWGFRPEWCILIFLLLVSFLVIYKHKTNIVRLMNGDEPQIFSKDK